MWITGGKSLADNLSTRYAQVAYLSQESYEAKFIYIST